MSDAPVPPPRIPGERPPGKRRESTTALGIVLLVLGSLGMALTYAGLGMYAAHVAGLIGPLPADVEFTPILVLDAVLNLLGKIGLITMGALLIRRSRAALPVTVVTFAISMTQQVFTASRISEWTGSGSPGAGHVGGFTCSTVLTIAVYVLTIVHLLDSRTRAEFDRATTSADVFD